MSDYLLFPQFFHNTGNISIPFFHYLSLFTDFFLSSSFVQVFVYVCFFVILCVCVCMVKISLWSTGEGGYNIINIFPYFTPPMCERSEHVVRPKAKQWGVIVFFSQFVYTRSNFFKINLKKFPFSCYHLFIY